jgi:hypothetical protein
MEYMNFELLPKVIQNEINGILFISSVLYLIYIGYKVSLFFKDKNKERFLLEEISGYDNRYLGIKENSCILISNLNKKVYYKETKMMYFSFSVNSWVKDVSCKVDHTVGILVMDNDEWIDVMSKITWYGKKIVGLDYSTWNLSMESICHLSYRSVDELLDYLKRNGLTSVLANIIVIPAYREREVLRLLSQLKIALDYCWLKYPIELKEKFKNKETYSTEILRIQGVSKMDLISVDKLRVSE